MVHIGNTNMGDIDNKLNIPTKKIFTEEQIEKRKEARKKYREKKKMLVNKENPTEEEKKQIEELTKKQIEHAKKYYKKNKEDLTEKVKQKYHEKKEKDGVETRHYNKNSPTNDDKINKALELLESAELNDKIIEDLKKKIDQSKKTH